MTRILVVDDGATDRELLVTVLRYAGYETLEAATGAQGLALAQADAPDLIIADILMPTMDGYELVRELRIDARTAAIPVIFYTATYVIEEVRELASACGVAHMIVKPCEPQEILRVVGEALSSTADPVITIPSEDFHRQHLRVLNAKLLQKVEELRHALVVTGTLHQQSDRLRRHSRSASASADGPPPEDVLSLRELEVLSALSDGSTNAEVAARLVISEATVQSHVKSILRKLGVRNRTEAAVRFLRASTHSRLGHERAEPPGPPPNQ